MRKSYRSKGFFSLKTDFLRKNLNFELFQQRHQEESFQSAEKRVGRNLGSAEVQLRAQSSCVPGSSRCGQQKCI